MAFLIASWPVYCATRDNNVLWKNRIRSDMPWFRELQELISQLDSEDIDYKLVHRCFDIVTTPTYGMEGRFLGIANRRRIWGACEQIVDVYSMSEVNKIGPDFEHCSCPQMPIVSYPVPSKLGSRSMSVQLIYSWVEIYSQTLIFETHWRASDNVLVGLGVTSGTSKRIFGSTDDTCRTIDYNIYGNDWIDQLILHTSEMEHSDNGFYIAITGVRVRSKLPCAFYLLYGTLFSFIPWTKNVSGRSSIRFRQLSGCMFRSQKGSKGVQGETVGWPHRRNWRGTLSWYSPWAFLSLIWNIYRMALYPVLGFLSLLGQPV